MVCGIFLWVIGMRRRSIPLIIKAIRDTIERVGYCDRYSLAITMGISPSTAYDYIRLVREFMEREGVEHFDFYWNGSAFVKKEGKK